ncbi:MAG: glycosyltransferase family 9 protein [Terracidiphilus sp.]
MHTQSKFRLLVVRLGAMGDILHALPAVTALRQAHPGWLIDWVVEPRWRALLAADGSAGRQTGLNSFNQNPAQPIVDQIHLAPTRDWRKDPLSGKTRHEIKSLRQALREADYDTVIDLQGAIRSAVVGRMAGCQRLIGEAEPRERAARWLFTEQVETHGDHVIEQDIELASAVAGDDLKPVAPWLPVDTAAEKWVNGILPHDVSQPSVLINPGAGWGAKRWPVERYAAVAQGLIDRGFRVLVNAGPGEVPLAEAIVQTAGAATPLQCSLEQLIALTRRITVAIAGDTGPLHLACALGRPVVGIYGPTDPSRNGPFGTRFKVLRSPDSRRDHTRHATPEAGLLTISPEDVLAATDELLAPENVR